MQKPVMEKFIGSRVQFPIVKGEKGIQAAAKLFAGFMPLRFI